MKFAVRHALFGVLCCWVAGVVQAAAVRDLYSAQLMVPEQLSQPAPDQLSAGLQEVLVKVSGRGSVVNLPQVRQALTAPAPYLQQFGYQSTQVPISAGDGREVLGQRLQLDFDAQQVNALLQQAGGTVLGYARPAVLVWLVAQPSGAGRDFLPPDGPVYRELVEYGKRRALPIELPLLDLTDQQALDASDLWGFFRAPIDQASARYRPDAVLAGRLYQHPSGSWETQWLLVQGAQTRTFAPAGSLSDQLQEVIGQAADLALSPIRDAGLGYVEEGFKLEVGNVDGIEDFLQLLDYARNLPPVESAVLSAIEHDRVTLRVKVQGGIEALQQSIQLHPRMAATPRLASAAQSDELLVYRWQE